MCPELRPGHILCQSWVSLREKVGIRPSAESLGTNDSPTSMTIHQTVPLTKFMLKPRDEAPTGQGSFPRI